MEGKSIPAKIAKAIFQEIFLKFEHVKHIICRRFVVGRKNFEDLYKPLVDTWALYDNAGSAPVLLDAGA